MLCVPTVPSKRCQRFKLAVWGGPTFFESVTAGFGRRFGKSREKWGTSRQSLTCTKNVVLTNTVRITGDLAAVLLPTPRHPPHRPTTPPPHRQHLNTAISTNHLKLHARHRPPPIGIVHQRPSIPISGTSIPLLTSPIPISSYSLLSSLSKFLSIVGQSRSFHTVRH